MNVKLFGMAKDILGRQSIQLENTENISCVGELKERLLKDYPALERLPTMGIAVNVNYAQDADAVSAQDEIVIIPPVSGG